MEIATESGIIRTSARSRYGKFVRGWKDGHGWTGDSTLCAVWNEVKENKPAGCSWYAYGLLMAREQMKGRLLEAKELLELLDKN